MITYVDTSALVKLVVEEDGSDVVGLVWDTADARVSAALIVVEARAALAAARRNGRLTSARHERAKGDLADLIGALHLVGVNDDLIARAAELAEREALRGYDAVHLAAALTVGAETMASTDEALCDAASRNGMHVANPLES